MSLDPPYNLFSKYLLMNSSSILIAQDNFQINQIRHIIMLIIFTLYLFLNITLISSIIKHEKNIKH